MIFRIPKKDYSISEYESSISGYKREPNKRKSFKAESDGRKFIVDEVEGLSLECRGKSISDKNIKYLGRIDNKSQGFYDVIIDASDADSRAIINTAIICEF